MAESTKIAWTDATWNPVRGCERVSEGCRRCYAEALAARHSYPGGWGEGVARYVTRPDGSLEARWTGVLRTIPSVLSAPLGWRSPRRVFVNSMSDLFHADVPEEFLDKVFAVMALAHRHAFQVLTKRPERMLAYLSSRARSISYWEEAARGLGWTLRFAGVGLVQFPLPNVWCGVSAEDQATFDERVEVLARIPAAIRFVSLEPLLGRVDIGNALDDAPEGSAFGPLSWGIVGGESGHGHREMDIDAARWVVEQFRLAGKPVFVKQDSGPRPGMRGRFTDAEWALKEWPR